MTTSKMLTKDSSGVQMLSVSPCLNLWVDVINLAILDLKNKDNNIREDAERWLYNSNSAFEWVCDHIGFDAKLIRKKLLEENCVLAVKRA